MARSDSPETDSPQQVQFRTFRDDLRNRTGASDAEITEAWDAQRRKPGTTTEIIPEFKNPSQDTGSKSPLQTVTETPAFRQANVSEKVRMLNDADPQRFGMWTDKRKKEFVESRFPSPPMNLRGETEKGFGTANEILGRSREEMNRRLLPPNPHPLARLAVNMINPVPGSLPQAAMLATGPGVRALGAATPGIRAGVTGALDAALGYAEGGPMGALLGGLGGAAAGGTAAGIEKLGQPSRLAKGMRKTKDFAFETGSPSVKEYIENTVKKDPEILLTNKGLAGLRAAASTNADKIVKLISQNAGPVQVRLPKIPNQLAKSYDFPLVNVGTAKQPRLIPAGTFEDADKFRRALRKDKDLTWRYVEGQMLGQADAAAPQAFKGETARLYQLMKQQYLMDNEVIRFVSGAQKVRQKMTFGGINPTDFPQAADITKALTKGKEVAVPGAVEAVAGAIHPESGFGVYHLGKGLKDILKRKPAIMSKVKPAPGPGVKLGTRLMGDVFSALPGVPRFPDDQGGSAAAAAEQYAQGK